ncbi:MAG: hypothetical protein R2705_01425 [Ilumatobacteraceae bacterium]
MELTDNPDSYMLLMDLDEDRLPIPETELRVPLTRGARFVVDQQLWHVVVHNGDSPRYALITAWSARRSCRTGSRPGPAAGIGLRRSALSRPAGPSRPG